MDAVAIVAGVFTVVGGMWALVSGMLAGGTAYRDESGRADHARVLADLGPVEARFTNRSLSRIVFGLLIGGGIISFCAVKLYRWDKPWNEPALGLALVAVLGLVIVLFVATRRYHTLTLHARGLVIAGADGARAAYYADVTDLSYLTVQYSETGSPVAKALVIGLSTGPSIEIANDFVGFGRIADALGKRTGSSVATDLAGEYEVTGTEITSGMPRTVRVRATSPQDARHQTLHIS